MTAGDEIRSAASAAGWAQAKGVDPWTDVFTRDAEHTELQAKMLKAANVSLAGPGPHRGALHRVLLGVRGHPADPVAAGGADRLPQRRGGQHEGPRPHGLGAVLADHGGDGLMSGQTRSFPPLDGYVECAYGGFGEGCHKQYDFVPYMDLPDGWFTKDGNSYCSEHWPMVRR